MKTLSSKLKLVMETAAGKTKNKLINNMATTASEEDLYVIGTALASLQKNTVTSYRRVDESELSATE